MKIENEAQKEILRLKVKVNTLLDINAGLDRQLKQLNSNKKQQSDNAEDVVGQYFRAIGIYMRAANKKDLWLSYKNSTANTKDYYRADKKEFESLFDEINNSELDYQQFVGIMADLGILKTADNKQVFTVTVNGKSKRVYMIRKSAVELFQEDSR